MKITTSQKNLKKALNLVERIVTRNVSLPILSNILLKTENGRLKITATNLEVGITAYIGAKIEEVGEIAVPGRILADFVNALHEETVTLSTKNNSLNINSQNYKTQILGFETKEYPIIPKIKTEPLYIFSAPALKTALVTVSDAISASETRPELAGLLLLLENKKATFAATDSFRLTEKKLETKQISPQSMIIPRNTVMELIRLCGETEGDVALRVADNQISFSNNDVELISRLIDGNYPDYSKVIPENFVSKALIDKNELEKNIRLAGLFSSNISDIKLQCSDNNLHISAKNSEKGEIKTGVAAVLKNEPFEISLNFNYLLDGLKIIDTEKVVIEFTGSGSPLVLRPNDEKRSVIYLIMPLRN